MVTTAPRHTDEPAAVPVVVPSVPSAHRPGVLTVEDPSTVPVDLAVADTPAVPAGSRPVRRPVPADRERGELDLAHRVVLADRITALVRDADRLHRGDTDPARERRAQIQDARGRLLDLDHALRSGIPITRRGERLIARMLAGVTVGTYAGHGPRALHVAAEEACAAIGSVTPFH